MGVNCQRRIGVGERTELGITLNLATFSYGPQQDKIIQFLKTELVLSKYFYFFLKVTYFQTFLFQPRNTFQLDL